MIKNISLILLTVTTIILNSFESAWMLLRTEGLRLAYSKYYQNDPDNYQPLPFKQVLDNTTSSTKKENYYWELTTNYLRAPHSSICC